MHYGTRQVVAFFVAPVVVPVTIFAYLANTNLAPFWVGTSTIIGAITVYVGALIFGVPAYLFLRARKWTFFGVAPAVGFAVGALMWLVFGAVFALLLDRGLSGVQFVFTDRQMLSGTIWPGGVLGAVVGTIFWLIARPDCEDGGVRSSSNGVRK